MSSEKFFNIFQLLLTPSMRLVLSWNIVTGKGNIKRVSDRTI